MKLRHSIRFTHTMLVICGLVFTAGCEKFVRHESENLAPFAEQTIDLIGSPEYSLSENQILYLYDIHEYIDVEQPYARHIALENQVGSMLATVVTYSLQIVVISEQDIPDKDKANRLADAIVALVEMVQEDQVVANKNIDADMIDDAVLRVRQSDDYLEALRLLLPLINEFSAHAGRVLDELRKENQKLVLSIEQAIDTKYRAAIELHREMRLAKDDMYRTLIHLSQYSVTRDPAHLDKMRSYHMFSVLAATENKKSLNTEQLARLHKEVTAELAVVNENYRQLLPDVEEYYKHRDELAEVAEFKEDAISEARLTFVVWSRAYQKMASGKENPAEWFDVADTRKLLFGAAKKAVGI